MDEQEIPRQWVEMKPEEILTLYVSFNLILGNIKVKVHISFGKLQKVQSCRA